MGVAQKNYLMAWPESGHELVTRVITMLVTETESMVENGTQELLAASVRIDLFLVSFHGGVG